MLTVKDEFAVLQFAHNPVIIYHWDILAGEAIEAYRTVRGYERFMSDVYYFLGLWETAGRNPHLYDRLLKRARAHGISKEFMMLCEMYNHEMLVHRRYANESTFK